MNKAAKKALANIQTIKMFSKHGWNRCHKEIKSTEHSSDEQLAIGFAIFQEIWYEDNGVEEWEFGEENMEQLLLDRYVDYLQHD